MKKNILITWWLGYIGSHTIVELENNWFNTIIVDNLSNSSINTLNNISKILWYKPDFFEVDLRNRNASEEIFKKYSFDWVIHFAWLKSVWESINKPFLYYENNITWSIILFELMQKYQVKNIIFSSSATVYSQDNISPLKEDNKLWTTNPYGTTKLILEQILQDLSITSDFNVISLRYFNPVWAHKSWLIWEKPNGIPNNLLPYIMDVATWKREKISVFWNDYPTFDGTWVRDYIHVMDLARAHYLALNKLFSRSNKNYKAINIWTGKWTSVLEMINFTQKISGKKINYEIVERRPGDLATVFADSSLAKEYLDWEAILTIKEAIEDSWRFNYK